MVEPNKKQNPEQITNQKQNLELIKGMRDVAGKNIIQDLQSKKTDWD